MDKKSIALWLGTFAACGMAYLGVGTPNHFFQPLFAAWLLFLAYRREWIRMAPGPFAALLVFVQWTTLTFLMKALIGAGVTYPFQWLQYPSLASSQSSEGRFLALLPSFNVEWKASSLATLSLDLTLLQSLLLFLTFLGASIRFQPFASLCALFLFLISIPSYLSFNWNYLLPAAIVFTASLQFQTREAKLSLS